MRAIPMQVISQYVETAGMDVITVKALGGAAVRRPSVGNAAAYKHGMRKLHAVREYTVPPVPPVVLRRYGARLEAPVSLGDRFTARRCMHSGQAGRALSMSTSACTVRRAADSVRAYSTCDVACQAGAFSEWLHFHLNPLPLRGPLPLRPIYSTCCVAGWGVQ